MVKLLEKLASEPFSQQVDEQCSRLLYKRGYCWIRLHWSRGAEKYFRRSRLNWREGAVSRESIRVVTKLDRLKNMISGIQEALDHPFTTHENSQNNLLRRQRRWR